MINGLSWNLFFRKSAQAQDVHKFILTEKL